MPWSPMRRAVRSAACPRTISRCSRTASGRRFPASSSSTFRSSAPIGRSSSRTPSSRTSRATSVPSTAASTSSCSTTGTPRRCAPQLVKNAARQFIQRNLGANDLMAVVTTGGRTDASQEFTSNRRLLLAAVDKFMGQKLDSATMTRNNEYFRQRDAGLSGPGERSRRSRARSTRPVHPQHDQERRRLVRRRARPTQDAVVHQRRHRLRHHRHHSRLRCAEQLGLVDHRRYPRSHRRRRPRQRQHLRRRSARPDHDGRRHHRRRQLCRRSDGRHRHRLAQ